MQANVVKKGLGGTTAPATTQALGRVDPASHLDGDIYTDDDGVVHDVMLNLVDISKNSDKYYILQLVETRGGDYVVFTRWGRTGTSGACKMETFQDVDKAVAQFGKMFLAKTGWDWEDQDDYAPQYATHALRQSVI